MRERHTGNYRARKGVNELSEAQPVQQYHATKPRPHVVRRRIDAGYRYYVYAFRGGPCVLRRDGDRPTKEEAQYAAMGVHLPPSDPLGKLAPYVRGRGVTAHRPLFIRELVKLCAQNERWTYFIADGDRAVKIGAAKCVRSRFKILQAHNSGELRVMVKVRGGEVLESAYHAWFAQHRISNEWFALHPEILAEIEYLHKLECAGLPRLTTPAR